MDTQQLKPITILGAGSWGTALALYLSRRGRPINLWSVEIAEVAAMLAERTNNRYLPGYGFPDILHPTANLAEATKNIDDILIAVPSIGFRETLIMLKPLVPPSVRITSATKGLDADTGQLLHEVVDEVLGSGQKFAALSGPSFAREVAAGLPTAVMVASHDRDFAQDLAGYFDSELFRIQITDDVVGVEISGAIKNVIAIATGVFDGMQLGANARSALITGGLSEIMRLGATLGGKIETFVGLSGVGDLLLTCTDDLSRNRRLGLALGKGNPIQEAEKQIGQIVEGRRNAELVVQLAEKHSVSMPICEAVWKILQGNMEVKEAVNLILNEGCSQQSST